MKILLIGDASNYHKSLSVGLAALGHDVTVASDGTSWLRTERDIDLSRRLPGKAGGALLWLRLNTVLRRDLRGYDIVQVTNQNFVPLKPCRIMKAFDYLRANNGAVYCTALASDNAYVRTCLDASSPLRYSEWRLPSGPTAFSRSAQSHRDQWLSDDMRRLADHLFMGVDGIVSALYEYHAVFGQAYPDVPMAYGGIPLDMSLLRPSDETESNVRKRRLRVLLTAHKGRENEKGMDLMRPMAERLLREHSDKVELLTPPNMPYSRFTRYLGGVDMVFDQMYSYTPATTALMLMATGGVPLSGAEPEYYDFIGEKELHPILNLDPLDLEGTYRRIVGLVSDRDLFLRMCSQGREFVRRHNSTEVVARRFEDFWLGR